MKRNDSDACPPEVVCPAKQLRFLPSDLPCLQSSTSIYRNVTRGGVDLRLDCQRRCTVDFSKEASLRLVGHDEPPCAKQHADWTNSWVHESMRFGPRAEDWRLKSEGTMRHLPWPQSSPWLCVRAWCWARVDDDWLPWWIVDSLALCVYSLIFAISLEICPILYQWQARAHGREASCPQYLHKRGTMQRTEVVALAGVGGVAFFCSF